MQHVSAEYFSAAAGEVFDLKVGNARVAMTLTDIKPIDGASTLPSGRRPFYLIFKSALPVILPQKIYELYHRKFGTLGIFLVPVARDGNGVVYQAVFN
jgi:hypothetical protein